MLAPNPLADDIEALLGSSSPLDHPLSITRFPTQSASSKKELRFSLRSLAVELAKAKALEKTGLPWWKLATFGELRSEKGCLRNNANVLSITGVEGDYDDGHLTPDEAESRLRAANIAALIYTTPSHLEAGNGNRWRVFAPLSVSHPPSEREKLMRRINGIFDGELCPASFTLSQAFYAGNVIGKKPMRVLLTDGRFLDHARELDSIALTKGSAKVSLGENGGSEALIRLAAKTKYAGKSEAEFRAAILKDAAASAHVVKESRQSQQHGERAIQRAWDRARAEPDCTELFDIIADPKIDASKASILTFLNPDQCATTPSRGYLVKGMLAPGDVGCIFGAPGAGKSLLAPRIGFAVAQGAPVFGMRTRPGKVFYVAAEDEHGMRGRASALRQRLGSADDFYVVGGVSSLAKDSPDLKALCEAVKRERPALIIIDTLAMAFPGLEENSSEAMSSVVAVARLLTRRGAAVLLIHHDTKDGGSTPRGHSVLNGALDMALHVKPKDGSGIIRGTLTKNRNGTCDVDIAFRIGTRELGVDDDGDAITAAFADELDPGSVPQPDRLTGTAKAALSILAGLAGTGRDRVPEDHWRTACIDSRAVSGSENRDTRKRMFNKALRELASVGRVITHDGFVSIVGPSDPILDAFDPLSDEPEPGPGPNRDSGGTQSRHPASGSRDYRDSVLSTESRVPPHDASRSIIRSEARQ